MGQMLNAYDQPCFRFDAKNHEECDIKQRGI